MKLLPFQHNGVKHLVSGQKKLLLDDQGLGKTVQTVCAFNKLGAKSMLIICPAAVRDHWAAEVKKWTPKGKHDVQVLMKMMDRVNPDSNVVVCGFPTINSPFVFKQLMARKWAVTVIDEIHWIKNLSSKRTQKVFGYRKKPGLYNKSMYFWGLSGTPITNYIDDLQTLLLRMMKEHISKQHRRDKDAFRYYYTKNVDKMKTLIFESGLALRREKGEVLKDLPKRGFITKEIMGVIRNKREWSELHSKAKAAIDKGIYTNHALSESINDTADVKGFSRLGLEGGELATLKRMVGVSKVSETLKYILKKLETGEKIVVFGVHRAVLEGLEFELFMRSFKTAMYYGGSNKDKAKHDFIYGDVQVLLCNIVSAGTGLDGLQAVSSEAVFVELPWTYAEISQATDRLHRIGQTRPVTGHILVSEASEVESYIFHKVIDKEKTFRALLTNG